MDVARPVQPSQRSSVRPVSRRSDSGYHPAPTATPLADVPEVSQPAALNLKAKNPEPEQPLSEDPHAVGAANQPRSASTIPVGVVTIAVFFMIALSGLAVMVYVSA